MKPCIIFLICFIAFQAKAGDSDQVSGLWATPESILNLYVENGLLHGRVIALKNPVYTAEEAPEPLGKPRLDKNNPDPVASKKPVLGLQLLSEYRFIDDVWQGKIYDPKTGKLFNSKLKLGEDGQLEIRGYIGVPMFGRTTKFESVATCKPYIVKMLTAAKLLHHCRL